MNKTAIDVVLLPSPEMMNFAIMINSELQKNNKGKIVLDKAHCLPHVSLCMGVIDNGDLQKVKRVLGNLKHRFTAFNLTALGIKANVIPTGKKVSGLTVTNTDSLQNLHETVMRELRGYLSYEVDASMLYNPSEIEDVTFTWIKGYGKKHDNPDLFHPHITVGFGETDRFAFPIDFTASILAVCQLGNYCTCRKVLATFDL